MSPGVELKDEK
jgi:hypothetical protein